MKIYKIKNKDTGMFSSGGICPSWQTKGKMWKNKSGLTNHIKYIVKNKEFYKNAEIIEYKIVESAIIPFNEYE